MTRTFLALEMNEVLQDHLAALIRQVTHALPTVRWVDPASIHLTLAFLGELDDEQLALARQAAEIAARQVEPFRYRLSHLGIFGSLRQPRVIWMGVDEPSGGLLRLHRLLNQALHQRGFTVDTLPFSPHLTLARVKAPFAPAEQQRLQTLLSGKQQVFGATESYPGRSLLVMKSELQQRGARYTCLHECALGEG